MKKVPWNSHFSDDVLEFLINFVRNSHPSQSSLIIQSCPRFFNYQQIARNIHVIPINEKNCNDKMALIILEENDYRVKILQ
jgi:hypothetical protein